MRSDYGRTKSWVVGRATRSPQPFCCHTGAVRRARFRPVGERGTILLEVILALVLFAAASTVIGIGLNASMQSVERVRLSTHAANWSISVFSELQIGQRSLGEGEIVPLDAAEDWTCQIEATPWGGDNMEESDLTRVEVVIRHRSGFVHRATQVLSLQPAEPTTFGGGL